MTRHDFLRSEFALELERIGRADVLVGIPSFNNAHTVGHVGKSTSICRPSRRHLKPSSRWALREPVRSLARRSIE
jgi:hypothetical protein